MITRRKHTYTQVALLFPSVRYYMQLDITCIYCASAHCPFYQEFSLCFCNLTAQSWNFSVLSQVHHFSCLCKLPWQWFGVFISWKIGRLCGIVNWLLGGFLKGSISICCSHICQRQTGVSINIFKWMEMQVIVIQPSNPSHGRCCIAMVAMDFESCKQQWYRGTVLFTLSSLCKLCIYKLQV